jgi:hypothetical protein
LVINGLASSLVKRLTPDEEDVSLTPQRDRTWQLKIKNGEVFKYFLKLFILFYSVASFCKDFHRNCNCPSVSKGNDSCPTFGGGVGWGATSYLMITNTYKVV